MICSWNTVITHGELTHLSQGTVQAQALSWSRIRILSLPAGSGEVKSVVVSEKTSLVTDGLHLYTEELWKPKC